MSYFKPLRRKIGVIALVATCVFAAGWLRSRTEGDRILLFGNTVVVSGGQKIAVVKRSSINVIGMTSPRGTLQTAVFFPHQLTSHFGWGHDSAREGVIHEFDIVSGMVPYRSIVIPLTLLSARLLLSKPRPVTPKTSK